ncbi:penicillin-binding transpeptidase domain-containing protein [Microbacteriaceae bacterium 4G12]
METKKFNMNKGAGLLMLIFSLLFFMLLLRFFYIQATGKVHGQKLSIWAGAKHNKTGVLEGTRGTIYDQTGKVLAQDTSAYKIVAILKGNDAVKDKEDTAKKLATVLDLKEDEILQRLNKPLGQVEFGPAGNHLTRDQKEKIDKMKLKGIAFTEGKARVYPNGDFASYVIGYATPNDKDIMEGQFGLEQSLNKYLYAKDGKISYQGDSRGLSLGNGEEKVTPPKDGDNVYLTMDQHIQGYLEDAMDKAAQHYDPSMLIGIVADAKTGKILAMSSSPSYDPNKRDIKNFLNDPIAASYEPGSTFKIFNLAAAINEGVYNGQEYYQSGKYMVGNTAIKDHNGGDGWGSITFDEGVARSSNVAFAILAEQKLGFERFRQYIHKFGFDEKTGIDLPGEGINKILFDKRIEQVTTAFGQGSTVTPIQLVQAMTAITNDGKMMKPYMVDRIVDPITNKAIVQNKPEVVGKPITKDTAQKVRQLLETVVTSPKGTGGMYKIDGYPVAGKTGTAQIPDKNGQYMTGRENYIFSFLGMAPVQDPQLIVYVAVKQPKLKDGEFGSTPLADIFKTVTKDSLQYLKIKPSQVKNPEELVKNQSVTTPDVVGKTTEEGSTLLEKNGLRATILGQGFIEKQLPQAGDSVIQGDRILLAGANNSMPSVIGWSLRDVMNLANILELKLNTSGQGYVTEQSIPEGTPIKKGAQLDLKLEPPVEAPAPEPPPKAAAPPPKAAKKKSSGN